MGHLGNEKAASINSSDGGVAPESGRIQLNSVDLKMIKNSIMQSSSRKRLNSGDNDANNGGRERLDSLGSSNQDGNQNKDSVVALTQYAKRKPSAADGEGLLPNLKTTQKLRNGGF